MWQRADSDLCWLQLWQTDQPIWPLYKYFSTIKIMFALGVIYKSDLRLTIWRSCQRLNIFFFSIVTADGELIFIRIKYKLFILSNFSLSCFGCFLICNLYLQKPVWGSDSLEFFVTGILCHFSTGCCIQKFV